MPLAGKGLLLTSMDIDPEHEEDAAAYATDWFVLIDGTSVGAVSSLMNARFESSRHPCRQRLSREASTLCCGISRKATSP